MQYYFPFVLGKRTCVIHPDNRYLCGWYGISKGNCEAKGCCFDEVAKGMRRCYYPEIGMEVVWREVSNVSYSKVFLDQICQIIF